MKVNAIVLAAGSGSRMKSKTKKQFMTIKGKPVIWFALNAFQKSMVDEIILVTSKEDVDYCKNIIKKYNLTKVSSIIEGGKERYNSVYNGLKETKCDYVLIHDGARPLINQQIIDNCINGAIKYKACVAGVPVKDTIKIVDEKGIVIDTPPRNQIWITQTPQAFEDKLIRELNFSASGFRIGNGFPIIDFNINDGRKGVLQLGNSCNKIIRLFFPIRFKPEKMIRPDKYACRFGCLPILGE